MPTAHINELALSNHVYMLAGMVALHHVCMTDCESASALVAASREVFPGPRFDSETALTCTSWMCVHKAHPLLVLMAE